MLCGLAACVNIVCLRASCELTRSVSRDGMTIYLPQIKGFSRHSGSRHILSLQFDSHPTHSVIQNDSGLCELVKSGAVTCPFYRLFHGSLHGVFVALPWAFIVFHGTPVTLPWEPMTLYGAFMGLDERSWAFMGMPWVSMVPAVLAMS